jgi:hypothetical protein
VRRPPPARRRLLTLAAGALLAVAAGALLALAPASPGWAHGAHAPVATNFLNEITAVTPHIDGLDVRTIEAGTGLQLTNRTGLTVEVRGYDGEPYLQVRPDGGFQNTLSAATYLNEDYSGVAPVPAFVDPGAEPSWQRISDAPLVRWYDHRTHWMGAQLPPPVAADPHSSHRIVEWSVPLRAGDTDVEVTGVLRWEPPPAPWPWWAAAVLMAGAVAALGLAVHTVLARVTLAAVAVAASAVASAYLVGRELDAGAAGAGELVVWLATGQLWPVLSALAVVAAAGWLVVTLRRPEASPEAAGGVPEAAAFALVVAGACLTIFSGLADTAVFARAVPPVPFDPVWARVAVLTVTGLGCGVTAAAALALRRARVPA